MKVKERTAELTLQEAAEYMNVSVHTIRHWINKGLLMYTRKNPGRNGRVYFSIDAIDKFLESCAV